MDWKGFFKKTAAIIWMLCLINLSVLTARYTASDTGMFFSWDYPLTWAFILGCISCVLAIFWPKKKK